MVRITRAQFPRDEADEGDRKNLAAMDWQALHGLKFPSVEESVSGDAQHGCRALGRVWR